MRNLLLWLVTLMVLAAVNFLIFHKELVLKDGATMLIKLAPVDPRSLIQGDYMALRYALPAVITDQVRAVRADGQLVVELDPNGVVSFKHIQQAGTPLATGERLLRYRRRGERLRLGAEAFFFQEGQASLYAKARYGELRVTDTGNAVLVGLRDDNLNSLGPLAQ